MACKNTCRLCNRLIISESVVYTAGTGLVIRIPAGSYNDNENIVSLLDRQFLIQQ